MVLAAFRDGDRALSLPEIAERTDLVKSTALRLLASLMHFDVVQKLEDGRYVLAPRSRASTPSIPRPFRWRAS